jgi:hypothetical protein
VELGAGGEESLSEVLAWLGTFNYKSIDLQEITSASLMIRIVERHGLAVFHTSKQNATLSSPTSQYQKS